MTNRQSRKAGVIGRKGTIGCGVGVGVGTGVVVGKVGKVGNGVLTKPDPVEGFVAELLVVVVVPKADPDDPKSLGLLVPATPVGVVGNGNAGAGAVGEGEVLTP